MDEQVQAGIAGQQGLRWRAREPFSGMSHLTGAILAVVGLSVLLLLARGDVLREVSFAIYGGSMILLYSASALYHSFQGTPPVLDRLRRADHAGIFLLIAGSYTPICLVALHNPLGWRLCVVVWTIAVIGVLAEILWKTMPGWVDLALYLIMGWLALVAVRPLSHLISPVAMVWLVTGGLAYTIGAIFYATEKPRLWPGVFGAHELWHMFVLAGSVSHYLMMLTFAAPPGRG